MFESKGMKLTEGNLFKKIVKYSIPMVLSGVLQLFYNAADLIVCGQFGSEHSTAAISCTGALINLIINLFLGLCVGSNVLMARCYGANDKEKGQRVVYTSMIFSVIFGVVLAIFGFFTSRTFLDWMGAGEVLDLSTAYLQIYFLGLPFSMIYNFGSAILRATGDTKRPFLFLTGAGVVNVLLNLLFVIVFHLDVKGVALATIASQAISALLIVVSLLKNKGFFVFRWREIRLYKAEAIEIARIGLPAGLQGSIFSLSNVLIQSSVNSLGTAVMDGSGAATSLEGFVYTAMNAVAQSDVAFVSANYGAKKKENIPRVMGYSAILIVMMNFLVGGIILLFHRPLISLYVSNEESIQVATTRLFVVVGTYFICGIMDLFAYSLRGIGYSMLPMIVALIGACGLRILWLYTMFPLETFHNIFGIVVSYPISWAITAAVLAACFIPLFKKLKL